MRSGQLIRATTQVSALRYFSITSSANRGNCHLTMQNSNNPARGFVTKAAWGVTSLAFLHRCYDHLEQNDNYGRDYFHPFWIFAALSTLLTAGVMAKKADQDAQIAKSIYYLKTRIPVKQLHQLMPFRMNQVSTLAFYHGV